MKRLTLSVGLCVAFSMTTIAQSDADKKAMVKEALSAAIPSVAENATVMDWEENVLREGSNGWTCMPSPPDAPGEMPMCLDDQWVDWAKAWMSKTEPNTTGLGFAYMLQGDPGGSNTDPYATEPTEDNEWIEDGVPHLMVLVPDHSALDTLPTDPHNGGPWVMWKGTPYAHVMVPALGFE